MRLALASLLWIAPKEPEASKAALSRSIAPGASTELPEATWASAALRLEGSAPSPRRGLYLLPLPVYLRCCCCSLRRRPNADRLAHARARSAGSLTETSLHLPLGVTCRGAVLWCIRQGMEVGEGEDNTVQAAPFGKTPSGGER